MNELNRKHVLVCALDWGLGHATRCVPIISCLLERKSIVSIAGNGASLELLKKEFPKLSFYELPSYSVKYPTSGFFFLNLGLQVPKILNAIRKEREEVKQLLKKIKIDAVISDNRYGCYSNAVPSVFITHQLNIQLPFGFRWSSKLLNYLHHKLIDNFNECWVPDQSQQRLTGKLTKTKILNVRFIGVLSRFKYRTVEVDENLVVGLVSGPEPQRTIFEKILIKEFKTLGQRSVIVRGLPQAAPTETQEDNLTLITHLAGNELEKLVGSAGIVIARSGYSTVMDLFALKKKHMILIPTPGQTEQEYLASELNRRKLAVTQVQSQINIQRAINEVKQYTGFVNEDEGVNLLAEEVENLLARIK
jgi:uncharacterized protein (TIGR00661 family)